MICKPNKSELFHYPINLILFITAYTLNEKICSIKSILNKMYCLCCKCMPECLCTKWIHKKIFQPISVLFSWLTSILTTIVFCVLDYADLAKDLGFIILLMYISQSIVVSISDSLLFGESSFRLTQFT